MALLGHNEFKASGVAWFWKKKSCLDNNTVKVLLFGGFLTSKKIVSDTKILQI